MVDLTTEMPDQLTAIIDVNELKELRNLYLKEWPNNCVGYYCLNNFISWLERDPEIKNLHIYTLNNDWRSDGLFLVVDRYQLFVNSLYGKMNNDLLTEAISLLDWKHGYKVSSFLNRHRPAVLDVVHSKQLELEYDSLTVMYYMPCATALQLDINCPQGYVLRTLSVADAETIDNVWPNQHQGSLFLIRRLISWNANMGVYVEETNELVAWCLRLQGGFLGALQVKDSHQRLGLGSLVTRATSRRIAELGDDVMALVGEKNVPSRATFDKLGFKVIDTCHWLRSFPLVKDFEWPNNEGITTIVCDTLVPKELTYIKKMDDNCNQLTKITDIHELKRLLELYKVDWPKHCVGYYCLDNYINWITKYGEIENLSIYTLNNDCRKDGLFLVADRYQLFINNLEQDSNNQVNEALSLLDWSSGFNECPILERYYPTILDLIKSKNLKLTCEGISSIFHISRQKALNLDISCPQGFYLSGLTLDDAKFVNDNWIYRHQGSLFLIERLIAWSVSMGLYAANTKELIAWCLRSQCGFLTMLHVKDGYKGLGFGKIVVSAATRHFAELGYDTLAIARETNIPSCKLFEKLDFTIVDKCYWLKPIEQHKIEYNMSNKLIEIPQEEWPVLRDLYIDKKTYSCSYFLIENYIQCKQKKPEEKVRILSLNGDWRSDGTFILEHCLMTPIYIFANTLCTNNERLLQALHCLDTENLLLFYGVQEHVKPTLDKYLRDLDIDLETCDFTNCVWYHLDKEKAEEFSQEAPSGIQLIKLEQRHAAKVDSVWPHRNPGTVAFADFLIRNNDGVGVINETGELVAWCTRSPLGALGLLQVMDSHKRLGLGSLVVRKLSRILAKNNIEIMAPVVFENVASRSMFEKLGFKAIDNVYWAFRPIKKI
ncbi:uncharacterized protein LOC119688263 [Teleopsis dalmanni]|uniref:uncharacterized protein LOC119688263 n=1 Tax=Teleopsis dalmanni TaxID=139649 RepID=UPI0018CF4EF4|nr:uncharacterized protein LOC119688263 [Teleopsis dalmanni]